MKIFTLALCFISLGSCVAQGQLTPPSDDPKAALLSAFQERKAGMYSSIGEKTAARLGDQVARILLERYSLDELQTEPFAKATAQMIASAFSTPRLIISASDKEPKVSILLLTYLKVHQPNKGVDQVISSTLERLGNSAGAER